MIGISELSRLTMTTKKRQSRIARLTAILVALLMVTSVMGVGFTGSALATDGSTATAATGQDVDIVGTDESKTASSAAVCRGGLDIVFTFDDTGSMGGEIGGAKASIDSFAKSIDESGVDARYGLVSFKDGVEIDSDLSNDVGDVRSAIDRLSARGGGDGPEDSWDAIDTAIEEMDRKSTNRLVVVHITDYYAHNANRTDTTRRELADKFAEDNIQMILAGDERNVKTTTDSLAPTAGVEGQSAETTDGELNSSDHTFGHPAPSQDIYNFTTKDIRSGTYVPLGDDFSSTLEEEVSTEITESCSENFEVAEAVSPNASTDDPLTVTADVENIGEAGGTQELAAVFEGEATEENATGDVDIAFVFDTTGSMNDEISGAQESLKSFAENVAASEGEARYGLVTFKDDYTIQESYTGDVDRMQSAIDSMRASGGGDFEEDSYDAVSAALNNLDARDDAQQVIIHVTDAASHTQPRSDTSQADLVTEIDNENTKYILAGPTKDELDDFRTPVDARPTEVADRVERSATIPLSTGEFGEILTDEISAEVREITGTAFETVTLDVGGSAAVELETETTGFPEGKYDVTIRSENSSANTTTYVVPEVSGSVDTAVRSIDRTEATAGSTVNVTTTATFSSTTADGAIIESFDPNLNTDQIAITDADNATVANYSERLGELTAGWGERETVRVDYEVTLPEDASAGDVYEISGRALDREAGAEKAVTGANSIEVIESDDGGETSIESATRSISDTSVTTGDTVDVTLDVNFSGSGVAEVNELIDPALPRGSVEIVDSGDGSTFANYRETTGRLSAAYSGVNNTTLTYSVTIPADADGETYRFSGSDATGDSSITVAEEGDITDVTREISPSSPAPGSTVTVSLDAEFRDGALSPSITDEISPALAGDNVAVASDDGATISEYQPTTGLVTANYESSREGAVFQYEITIPEDAEVGDTYDLALRGSDDIRTITVGDEGSELATYADPETGVVGPAGLGDAAADFRAGEIGPGTLGEVAAAFRSAEPVA